MELLSELEKAIGMNHFVTQQVLNELFPSGPTDNTTKEFSSSS